MSIRAWLCLGSVVAFLSAGILAGRIRLVGGKDHPAEAAARGQSTAGEASSDQGDAANALGSRPTAASADPMDRRQLLAIVDAALRDLGSAEADAALRMAIPALLDLGQFQAVQRLLAQTPPGPARDNLLGVFAFAWAARDPAAALAWADRLPDENERSLSLARVCNAIDDGDPKNALALTARLNFQGREQVLESILQRWALHEPSLAQEWVLQQTAGEQRDQLVSRLATVDARQFPADAAVFALAHLPPGDIQAETIITIIHEWAARDPAGASRWVQAFPAGEFRDRAAREIDGMAKYLP